MYKDPIIKKIREVRHEIEAMCENDSQKYYEYLQEVQKKYSERLVSFKKDQVAMSNNWMFDNEHNIDNKNSVFEHSI
jgi:hypothetical protein